MAFTLKQKSFRYLLREYTEVHRFFANVIEFLAIGGSSNFRIEITFYS